MLRCGRLVKDGDMTHRQGNNALAEATPMEWRSPAVGGASLLLLSGKVSTSVVVRIDYEISHNSDNSENNGRYDSSIVHFHTPFPPLRGEVCHGTGSPQCRQDKQLNDQEDDYWGAQQIRSSHPQSNMLCSISTNTFPTSSIAHVMPWSNARLLTLSAMPG